MNFFITGMCVRSYFFAAAYGYMLILQKFVQAHAFVTGKIGNQCFVFFYCTGVTAFFSRFNKLQRFGYAAQIADCFFVFNKFACFGNKFLRGIFAGIYGCNHAVPCAVQKPVSLFALVHAFGKLNFVFANQKRHSSYFFQVHAHRVVNAYAFGHAHIGKLGFVYFVGFTYCFRLQVKVVVSVVNNINAFLGNQFIHIVHIVGAHVFSVLHGIHNFTISENTAM